MANSYAKVKFKDGTVKYAFYQNTSDYLGDKLVDTRDDVDTIGKNYNYDKYENCNHEEEEIEIAQHYGRGTTWYGRACRKCGFITFNYESYVEQKNNNPLGTCLDQLAEDKEYSKTGLPDWY